MGYMKIETLTHRLKHKQTNKHEHGVHENKDTDRQTQAQTDKHTQIMGYMKTETQTDRLKHKQTNKHRSWGT